MGVEEGGEEGVGGEGRGGGRGVGRGRGARDGKGRREWEVGVEEGGRAEERAGERG